VFRMRSTWSATRRPAQQNVYDSSTCPSRGPNELERCVKKPPLAILYIFMYINSGDHVS
jgi:hypothetical protein